MEDVVRHRVRLAEREGAAVAEWLRLTAQRNGVGADWFEGQREAVLASSPSWESRLELDDLTVEYSGRSSS